MNRLPSACRMVRERHRSKVLAPERCAGVGRVCRPQWSTPGHGADGATASALEAGRITRQTAHLCVLEVGQRGKQFAFTIDGSLL